MRMVLRHSSFAARLVAIAFFLALIFSGGQRLRAGDTGQPWTGKWVADSPPNKQVLDLRQAGLSVSGEYFQTLAGQPGRKGTFKGTVDGRDPRVLTGTLTIDPYRSPDGSSSGSGYATEVRWVMSVIGGRASFVYQFAPLVTMSREGPASNPPASPGCSLTPDQALQEILRRYRSEIPKGRAGNGIINNIRSKFDKSLEPFTCGGYQHKVLDLLDRLRGSKDPQERCLFQDFDYGPIEIGIGLHQAVVIYRKGSDWKWTGTVLDPWFNQTPEAFSLATWQWRSCMTLGGAGGCTVNGASWLGGYRKQYPTTGGPYPGDAGATPARPRSKAGGVTVNCPLIPYLIDEQGRVSGYRQNQELHQIPDVDFMTCRLEDGTFWTDFEFVPRKGLRLCLDGAMGGPAVVVATADLLKPVGSRELWQYRLPVRKGEAYALPLTDPRSPLAAPSGPVSATPFTPADVEALAIRLRPATGDPGSPTSAPVPSRPAVEAKARMYRHPEGAYRVSLSSEWSLMERKPRADLDMAVRSPDRDACAVYFGRDHEDASRKGVAVSLDAMAARLSAKGSGRTERLAIGQAQGILVSVYDREAKAMLWHLCLGHGNRVYYLGVEALPGTGQRDLPPRIREVLLGLVMEP